MCLESRHLLPHRADPERGVALLWTLATVVVVAASSVALVRVAAADRLRRNVQADAAVAADLARAAEAPILEWLATRAGAVVLHPDAEVPAVHVLHQRWSVADRTCELRVTAFDQDGMVAARDVADGSPMRLLVPDFARAAVDGSGIADFSLRRGGAAEDPPLGLDTLGDGLDGVSANGAGTDDAPHAAFPLRWDAKPESLAAFGPDGWIELADGRGQPAPYARSSARDSLGAVLATHNAGRLNVHTAPLALVEAVYRLTGRGGAELVAAARAKGDPVPNIPPPTRGDGPDAGLPDLATSSNAFAFRVDARVGRARPSWWLVFVRGGDAGWSLAQRIPVP